MLAHQYKVWEWGPRKDPSGSNEKYYVGITTIAKRDPDGPFEVFNELVAMRLGQLLGLPVPAGIVVPRGDQLFFSSCVIGAAGGDLPRADLERFATDKEYEACGLTVFDSWIANTDRHDKNMWYDYYGDQFFAFDHGRSLLGTSGETHLTANRDRVGIRHDEPCLRTHMRSFLGFSEWHDRICNLPKYMIKEAVSDAATVGVDHVLAVKCREWLLRRRDILPDLFRANAATLFPRIRPTLFDPFGDTDDLFPEYCI